MIESDAGMVAPGVFECNAIAQALVVLYRRDKAVLLDWAQRLHKRVMAQPGEVMTVYAKHLEVTPQQLHRPMLLLKKSGRVRSTGVRGDTRYFPVPKPK